MAYTDTVAGYSEPAKAPDSEIEASSRELAAASMALERAEANRRAATLEAEVALEAYTKARERHRTAMVALLETAEATA